MKTWTTKRYVVRTTRDHASTATVCGKYVDTQYAFTKAEADTIAQRMGRYSDEPIVIDRADFVCMPLVEFNGMKEHEKYQDQIISSLYDDLEEAHRPRETLLALVVRESKKVWSLVVCLVKRRFN